MCVCSVHECMICVHMHVYFGAGTHIPQCAWKVGAQPHVLVITFPLVGDRFSFVCCGLVPGARVKGSFSPLMWGLGIKTSTHS